MHWHKYGKWCDPLERSSYRINARMGQIQFRTCRVCGKTKARWVVMPA